MKKLLVGIIKCYQLFISPWIGPRCRFIPTCSDYALEAINRYGVFRGGIMSLKRILHCHPFHPGGYDPVKDEL